jgi:hypothetical protein
MQVIYSGTGIKILIIPMSGTIMGGRGECKLKGGGAGLRRHDKNNIINSQHIVMPYPYTASIWLPWAILLFYLSPSQPVYCVLIVLEAFSQAKKAAALVVLKIGVLGICINGQGNDIAAHGAI